MNFKTHCHGKWILAGEHAVLRGAPAILFPLSCCQLNLEYLASNTPWQIQLSGNLNETHLPLIQQVLQHAFELSKKTPPSRGTLCIENHIPTGSGLGASAALCTAIAKWFMHATWILENNLLEFGRQLENLFHGESSGADIAVSALNQSIYFIRHETPHPFTFTWQPHWYLSYCGEQSTTSDCLKQVDLLWKKNPDQAQLTDTLMKDSVLLAKHALGLNSKSGIFILKEAIEQSYQAFRQWDLITPKLMQHMDTLIKAGALAVKPTGSGKGGFVLSLWTQDAKPSFETRDYYEL